MGYPCNRIRLATRIGNGPMVMAVTNHTLSLVALTSEASSLELIYYFSHEDVGKAGLEFRITLFLEKPSMGMVAWPN